MSAQHNNAQAKVAVLGLGLMGAGMARKLVEAGYTVAVYNRNPHKAAPFEGIARIAESPREAARGADFIVCMVADDDASGAMWLGENGAFNGARPGAICIDSSTLSTEWVARWAAEGAARQCACLDAPVTGSRSQAAAGELNFLVGGLPEVVARATPLLSTMGKSITPLGPIGSGAMFKLINNFVCGVQLASLAEAMAMIDRSGLDRAKAVETLMAGAPASPLVKTVTARMMSADYTPNFLVRLMAKDLDYAARAAQAMSLELATARTAHATFAGAAKAGFGEEDIAAVYKYVRGDAAL
ncbi:MAG: NAD(P)-dependent oxidoreductase [Massilia sp.]